MPLHCHRLHKRLGHEVSPRAAVAAEKRLRSPRRRLHLRSSSEKLFHQSHLAKLFQRPFQRTHHESLCIIIVRAWTDIGVGILQEDLQILIGGWWVLEGGRAAGNKIQKTYPENWSCWSLVPRSDVDARTWRPMVESGYVPLSTGQEWAAVFGERAPSKPGKDTRRRPEITPNSNCPKLPFETLYQTDDFGETDDRILQKNNEMCLNSKH